MDIFTTQLTRVVPVPIKPASLKVKALLKDAAASQLKEDPDHLENHEYYFTKNEEEGEQHHANHQGSDGQKSDEQQSLNSQALDTSQQENKTEVDGKKTIDKDQHLDLYV